MNKAFKLSHRAQRPRRPYSPSNGTILAHCLFLGLVGLVLVAGYLGQLDAMADALLR